MSSRNRLGLNPLFGRRGIRDHFDRQDALPSDVEGADFVASFHVSCEYEALEGDPRAQRFYAYMHIRDLAAEVSKTRSVTRVEDAQRAVNDSINAPHWLPHSAGHVSAQVRLMVTVDVAELAKQHQRFRGELTMLRLEQQLQLERLHYLKNRIFADTGLTRAWLLEQGKPIADILDSRIDTLAEKVAPHSPQRIQVRLLNLVEEFINGLSEDERRYLLQQVADVFSDFRRGDLSEELRKEMQRSDTLNALRPHDGDRETTPRSSEGEI